MRAITPEIVRKWKMQDRNDPKPFPGNYPTRWLIEGAYYWLGRKYDPPMTVHRLFYFGKPNRLAALKIVRINNRRIYGGDFRFWEFDRGGLIKEAARNILSRELLCDGFASTLCQLYYFYGGRPEFIFGGWDTGYWSNRTRLLWKGHRIVIYNHYDTWDREAIDRGRNWLQSTKLKWE